MKKKLRSKVIALLTTIFMVISIYPLSAFAAEGDLPSSGGTGPAESADTQYTNGFAADGSYQPAVQAEDGYYEINNAGQIYRFARLVNGYYNSSTDYALGQNAANARLTADITVNETLHYQGTFDGSGLYFFRQQYLE